MDEYVGISGAYKFVNIKNIKAIVHSFTEGNVNNTITPVG